MHSFQSWQISQNGCGCLPGAMGACSCSDLSSHGSLAIEKQAVGLDAPCIQTAAHTPRQISSCLFLPCQCTERLARPLPEAGKATAGSGRHTDWLVLPLTDAIKATARSGRQACL